MSGAERPTKRTPRRVHRELTPDEQERLRVAREEAEADRPRMIERAHQLEAAIREETVSGQLRQAIALSQIQYADLARHASITPRELADFMVGEAQLTSDAFDRLAALLGCRLVSQAV